MNEQNDSKGTGQSGSKQSMTREAASRIQSAGDRAPASRTTQTEFGRRAQSAGDIRTNTGGNQAMNKKL
jgi:hypothetical protein